jgi:hypothetical protein
VTILGVVQRDGSIKGPHLPYADEFIITSRVVYVIDGGDVFEGTPEQFEDCFGGPSTIEAVQCFCDDLDYSLRIIYL